MESIEIRSAEYRVDVTGGQGVAVGDHAQVNQYITEVYNLGPAPNEALALAGGSCALFDAMFARHATFGGRDQEFAWLDRTLEEQPGGFVFVTARSGFGKTALLANWIRRPHPTGTTLAYHFVSRADECADEAFAMDDLCQQLMAAQRLEGALPTATSRLRALYRLLIHRPPPADTRIVVVLDAIDEAQGWSVGEDLFEQPLPPGVFVVFSAREMAGRDWLAELGLDGIPTLTLGALDRAEIAELLPAQTDPALLDRLMEESGGDPYYASILVKDIQLGRICKPADVGRHPEGLDGYFGRWLDELAEQSESEAVRDMLDYLTYSRGRLSREDLIQIRPDDALDVLRTRRATQLLDRHLVGNADGYALAHDRFKNYLASIRVAEGRQAQIRHALLKYTGRWREDGMRYQLEHRVDHLSDVGAYDEILTLVNDPDWYAGKIALDPSAAGFRRDLEAAQQLAAQLDAQALAHGAPPTWLATELQLWLADSTLRSFAGKLSPALLRELLGAGWSVAQLLAAVRSEPNPERRAIALEELAPRMPAEAARDVLAVAQGLPDRSEHGNPRVRALKALLPRLPVPERTAVVRAVPWLREGIADDTVWIASVIVPALPWLDATTIATALEAAAEPAIQLEHCAAVAGTLAERLGWDEVLVRLAALEPPAKRARMLEAVAPAIGDPVAAAVLAAGLPVESRGPALAALATRLPAGAARELVVPARAIADDAWRCWTLIRLGCALPHDERANLARDMQRDAAALADLNWRMRVLAAVAEALEPMARAAVWVDIIAALPEVAKTDDRIATLVLATAPDDLTPALLTAAARAALLIPTPHLLLHALEQLAPRLGAGELALWRDAADAVSRSARSGSENAFVTIIQRLPPDERDARLTTRMDELEPRGDAWRLTELAKGCPPHLWPTLLARAESAAGSSAPLAKLVDLAPPEHRGATFDAALRSARAEPALDFGVYEHSPRGNALADLAGHVPEPERPALVREAVELSRAIHDAGEQAQAMLAFTPHDPGTLEAIDALDDEPLRARLLEALIPDAHEHDNLLAVIERTTDARQRARLLALAAKALPPAIANLRRELNRYSERDRPFAELASLLPEPLLAEALDVARDTTDEGTRIAILLGVLPRADDRLRKQALRAIQHVARGLMQTEDGSEVCPLAYLLECTTLDPWLADHTVDAALSIADPTWRGIALGALIGQLASNRQRHKAVKELDAVMAGTASAGPLARVLTAALPAAPADARERWVAAALEALDQCRGELDHLNVLGALLPWIPQTALPDQLNALDAVNNPSARALARAWVVGRLGAEATREQFDIAWREASAIEPAHLRLNALTRLVPAAPPDRRAAVTEVAIVAALNFQDEGIALAGDLLRAAQLTTDDRAALLENALRTTLASEREQPPADAADPPEPFGAGELPVSPFDSTNRLAGQPIMTHQEFPSGRTGAESLNPMLVSYIDPKLGTINFHKRRADQLPDPDHVELAVELMRTARRNDPNWLAVLADLLPHRAMSELPRLLEAGGADWDRALALELLAPPLPRFYLPRLGGGRELKHAEPFTRMLAACAGVLAGLPPTQGHQLLRRALGVLAASHRPSLLVDLVSLRPLLLALGGPNFAAELAAGIKRVGQRWP